MFERSDRARAVLYRLIENYRDTRFNAEFRREFEALRGAIAAMKTYDFTEDKFKPTSAEKRLGAVQKVLDHRGSSLDAPASAGSNS